MQIGRARESWLINHKALTRFMDLPALACTSNLHEPHQNKNHSLNDCILKHEKLFIIKLNVFMLSKQYFRLSKQIIRLTYM